MSWRCGSRYAPEWTQTLLWHPLQAPQERGPGRLGYFVASSDVAIRARHREYVCAQHRDGEPHQPDPASEG
jgi:hypothetical protein